MLCRNFQRDEDGSVLPIFALALIPLLAGIAGAVDYSRAASERTRMQNAMDATALMLSREAVGTDALKLSEKAKQYFDSQFSSVFGKDMQVSAQLTPEGTGYRLKLSGSGRVDGTFARAIGMNELPIAATTEVVWGTRKLELALALDNTGSMSSNNKMRELQKAAKTLIDVLKKAGKKEGDVKVAIVPFSTAVNVGTSQASASWLDWTEWDIENGGKRRRWNGCVRDREQARDYDVTDAQPDNNPATKFPAYQASSCPVEMMPLTTQWGSLVSTIESMKPSGNTNVTIGLVWAWHALSSGVPLTEASDPNRDTDKVIVLLTDGDNTENRWTSSQSLIDARTKKACDNAKAAQIKIYTIRVIEGNASLLRGCASETNMYYDVQNAEQLDPVFEEIGSKLARLRIAR